jgi:hypothetical protein
LACVYEIQANVRSEKHNSICSDSQAALKALQAAKTISPLVMQCQRALSDISTYHSLERFWVPGHSGIRGNEIADELAKGGFRSLYFWTVAGPGGLEAEYKVENSVLVGQTAYDTVAGTCWHSETGSRVDL